MREGPSGAFSRPSPLRSGRNRPNSPLIGGQSPNTPLTVYNRAKRKVSLSSFRPVENGLFIIAPLRSRP